MVDVKKRAVGEIEMRLIHTCTGPGPNAGFRSVGGCLIDIEVPFGLGRDDLATFLLERDWFLSCAAKPDQGAEAPLLLAAICEPCARVVMPEIAAEAVKHRKGNLS